MLHKHVHEVAHPRVPESMMLHTHVHVAHPRMPECAPTLEPQTVTAMGAMNDTHVHKVAHTYTHVHAVECT